MRARVAVVLVLSSLAACAPGPDTLVSPDAAAGFWLGLWHGMTVVVTFPSELPKHFASVGTSFAVISAGSPIFKFWSKNVHPFASSTVTE